MSIKVNGTVISIPAYRALQIGDFLASRDDSNHAYGDVSADKLLNLMAQLLPGDGVTATTLQSTAMRKKALHDNDFQGAVVDLLEAFAASRDFVRLTEGKEHLLRRADASGITTAHVIQREFYAGES